MRDKAIWEPEEKHVLRIEPKLRARSFCFLLAERYQPLWRIGFAVRMRASAVADDDNLSTQSLSAGVGDQTPAAQAFIVWMGRDNDERPILERLTQRRETAAPERRSRVRLTVIATDPVRRPAARVSMPPRLSARGPGLAGEDRLQGLAKCARSGSGAEKPGDRLSAEQAA